MKFQTGEGPGEGLLTGSSGRGPEASRDVLEERQPERHKRTGFPGLFVSPTQPPLPLTPDSAGRPNCEQMVLTVQGPRGIPPDRLAKGSPKVCRELQGRGWPGRGRGEAGGRATLRRGCGERCGAEGRGARPGWPLKGRPSWGGHFNRPQLNHCRKLLTAP